jgi:ATP-dependent RNA helicase SUPV3L1/SUV3
VLPEDWVAGHVDRIDRTDGDIHVLMDRIAAIRVWTFIAHRNDWMKDGLGWQERTREVEDRLSDALHEKLTHQFVDSRTAHLSKRLRGDDLLTADVTAGVVEVDGHRLGQLEGLRFRAERTGLRTADRAVQNAANAALRPVLAARIDAIATAPDTAFSLDDRARIMWQGDTLALLRPGAERLRPQIDVLADERIEPAQRLRVEERLRAWIASHIAAVLAPLARARDAELPAALRGIVFQLSEHLGSIDRAAVDRQLAGLTEAQRKTLARLGIRMGVGQVYMPALLKAAAVRLRGQLWIAAHPDRPMPEMIPAGRVNVVLAAGIDRDFYAACGFRPIGAFAYRVDVLERFAAEVRKLAREKTPVLPPAVLSLIGAGVDTALPILKALGFRATQSEAGIVFRSRRRKTARPAAERPAGHSAFAKLKELMPS